MDISILGINLIPNSPTLLQSPVGIPNIPVPGSPGCICTHSNPWLMADMNFSNESQVIRLGISLGISFGITWDMLVTNFISGWWGPTYPSEKYDESSVGMMKFPTEWEKYIYKMFQTTNQLGIGPRGLPHSKCTSLRKIMAIVNQAMVLSLLHIIHAYYPLVN